MPKCKPSKRKYPSTEKESDDKDEPPDKSSLTPLCIIHFETLKIFGKMQLIKDLKEPTARFEYICEIRDKRLSLPKESPYRMEAVCIQIPNELQDQHGYHRNCYANFINHLDKLLDLPSISGTSPRLPRRLSSDQILFGPDCIFCNKDGPIRVKVKGTWIHQKTSFFEYGGGKNVHIIAEERHDEVLLKRIRGMDLFACEARYHASCRKKYIAIPEGWHRSKDLDQTEHQKSLEQTHSAAFEKTIKYIQDKVIKDKDVIQLSHLRLIYVKELRGTPFENDEYRADKLKNKIENHPTLGSKVKFALLEADGHQFNILYSSNVSVELAIGKTYQMASKHPLKDAAETLRAAIFRAYEQASNNPEWPPDVRNLTVEEGVIPGVLKDFLDSLLVSSYSTATSRSERIVFSIGQDICRAVTNGEWKLPKHILLCVTFRHLFRSKQLLAILNRLGHCENATFASELEVAISEAVEAASSLLTSKIAKGPCNALFHSEWDNFNQMLSGIHGSPMCNIAGGIMLQETKEVEHGSIEDSIGIPQSDTYSVTSTALPDYFVRKRGPAMNISEQNEPAQNAATAVESMRKYLTWAICRQISSKGKQIVPAYAGFVSCTGKLPEKRTTIDYYPMINEPITEFKVVKEILDRCAKATEEVGQKFCITTFDLGVVMKAMPIIWDQPENFKKHIVLIGSFHTAMNYLHMIGRKMAGSGYSEILVEANLVTSGCLNGVTSGKSYSKSLWCLKTVSEALERILFTTFYDRLPDNSPLKTTSSATIDALIRSCTADLLSAALGDKEVVKLLEEYTAFQDEVRSGLLGKTAQFWMSFLDHARLVMLLLFSVKTCNFALYHKIMFEMADLFFAFGGHNYSRYLTWFGVFLNNIETSHPGAKPLLENGAISVARSIIPGNLSAVDKTMEETFMRFCKSKPGANPVGITGLLTNYSAYQRWIRTASERSKYYEATLDMCGISDHSDESKAGSHRETSALEIKRGEAAVQRVMSAFEGFLNPFDVSDAGHLYILSSGSCVRADIEHSVMQAEVLGREAKDKFIKERLTKEATTTKDFFQPVKKLGIRSLEEGNKITKLTSSQGKTIMYKEQGDIAFQLIVKSQLLEKPISIEELMSFCLTPVPHSLGTSDGFMAKTDKAALARYISAGSDSVDVIPRGDKNALYIEDGNSRLHSMVEVPSTFKEICMKLLQQLPQNVDVLVSSDMYYANSVKSQERIRRGVSDKLLLEGENTRRPADYKMFLQNDDNKTQLFQLMLRIWGSESAAPYLVGRFVMLVVKGSVFKLVSEDGKNVQTTELYELKSNQEETDTRVVLYAKYAKSCGYQRVIIRSSDSDIFFILLYFAHSICFTILLDTGSGLRRRMLNISDLAEELGSDYVSSILGLYVFTGEDANCSFKGKGKVNPMKKLEKHPRFQPFFASLGTSWDIPEHLVKELEKFTCIIYGHPRLCCINDVRSAMLKKMVGDMEKITQSSKVDLSKLPPCQRSLIPHIKRVNYRVSQWKVADQPFVEIPDASLHGWRKEQNYFEPVWSDGPILPQLLIDLVQDSTQDENDNDPAEIDVPEYESESSDDENTD